MRTEVLHDGGQLGGHVLEDIGGCSRSSRDVGSRGCVGGGDGHIVAGEDGELSRGARSDERQVRGPGCGTDEGRAGGEGEDGEGTEVHC